MSAIPACPLCASENTYQDGELFICPDCAHEWNPAAQEVEVEAELVIKDSNGNVLNVGDAATLVKDLRARHVRTKSWITQTGIDRKGRLIDKGFIYKLISSRVYLGEAVHKGTSYPGEHDAIITQELWDRVHAMARAVERSGAGDLMTGGVMEQPILWERDGAQLKAKTGAYLIGDVRLLKDIVVRAGVPRGEGQFFDHQQRPQITSARFVRAFELATEHIDVTKGQIYNIVFVLSGILSLIGGGMVNVNIQLASLKERVREVGVDSEGRLRLDEMATALAEPGVRLVSVHHDISTVTGEEVIVFSLAEAPVCRPKKQRA